MPLLTRQDPPLELFKFYDLVGTALTKAEKILGEILKVLFYLIFMLPLCTYHCLTPISHSTCSFFALIFLCSPVFVDMYPTKQVLCSSCSVATVFISF